MSKETIVRFTKKDIFCISCNEYHSFDMILMRVACPKEHPCPDSLLDWINSNKED